MFWGEYCHQLDEKGRLIIPARYRELLLPHAILTRGLDQNLVLYPQSAWRTVSERLNQLPITHPASRALRRLLYSGAVEVELDRQGRLLIPGYLRDHAALHDAVLIAGMETYLELWEPTRWRVTLNDVSQSLAEAEQVLNLGI
jgi:MraZ protein